MTTFPTVTTRLALDSNPNETPSWIDVSAYHRGIYCRRGRQHELNRVEAGIARVRLDNRDRRFEPEYPGDLVNLCTNPSMEIGTGSPVVPTGWSVATNGDGAIARASSPEKYGSFSCVLSASTGTESDLRYNYTFTPNTQYTVSAWFYITTHGTVASWPPYLYVLDGGTGSFSTNLNTSIVGAWQRVSVTFTTSATAGSGYVDAPRCLYNITELITNGDFETAGGGGADVFANWLELGAGDADVIDETVITHGGGHAAKLLSGSGNQGWVYQRPAVVASRYYTWTFWTRGDGTNAGRYGVYDMINGAWIRTMVSTGVAGTTWTQVTYTFATPVGCTQVELDLSSPTGDGNIAYFDDVSTHPSDILIYTDGVQIETGTLTDYVDGDQTDCRWEGTAHASQSYRGGPYYPYILSERRLNHRVTWLGVTYDLFTGFIEDWPVRWPHKGMDAIVEVPAYDGLAVLAIPEVRTSLPEEKTGARVNRLLTSANWTTGGAWVLNSSINSVLNSTTRLGPVGDRLVSDGESTMQALDLSDQETKALEHLRTVEETENGLVFVNGAGQLVFHSRHRRLRYPYTVSQATFGDGGGSEIPYADLEPEYTVHEVRNDVHVKVTGGDTYDATDATSKGKYHKRSYSRELALAGSAAHEAQSAANWILNRYKDQHIRFRRIVVKLASVPQSLWPTLLGLEIGDRVTAIRRQDSNGDAMEQDCHVEAIEHDIPPELADWTITYDVSPANANSYWRLGDGALATSTRLAY